jgi:DNA end-binding protein Ku
MASMVWKGHLTFGLVSMPVRLLRAARAEPIKLRQLYRSSTALPAQEEETPNVVAPLETQPQPAARVGSPLQLASKSGPSSAPEEVHVAPVRRVFQSADESLPVAPTDLVKGYEYEKGQYVVLEEQELRTLMPQTSTEIQVVEFVRFQEIDPLYLETSYYVVPDENAEKAYALLLEAMRQTGYAAIGQLTMHRRDHVIILRPGKTGLLGHTMFYPDEVRSTQEFRTNTSLVAAKELELAKSLIGALAQSFEPARFKNAFRERLNELIQSRIEGQQTTRIDPRTPAKVIDIMEALKRSLAQATAASQTGDARSLERKPATAERSRGKAPVQSTKRKR